MLIFLLKKDLIIAPWNGDERHATDRNLKEKSITIND